MTALPVLPKDGGLLVLIMKSMGIHECEPQVIPQLLEFMYRHCIETLQDATEIAEHVKHKKITLEDVRCAIQNKATRSFVLPPSRELLLDLAARKNSEPLPLLSENPENLLRLPKDEHCLFGQQAQLTALSQQKAPVPHKPQPVHVQRP